MSRTANVEVILEAADLISKFPKDKDVLVEQKRIINKYLNELIKECPIQPSKPKRNTYWQKQLRKITDRSKPHE